MGHASNSDYYSRIQKNQQHGNNQPRHLQNPYIQQYSPQGNFVPTPSYQQIRGLNANNTLQPVLSDLSDTTNTYVDFDVLSAEGFERGQRTKKIMKKSKKAAKAEKPVHTEAEVGTGKKELRNEKRLFSFLFSKEVPPIPSDDERKPYPWKTSSYLSRSVFFWIWPILIKGYKRTLVPDDLWYLPDDLKVETMHATYRVKLEKIIRDARRRHVKKGGKSEDFEWPMWAIPYALFLTFRLPYLMSTFFLACSFVCQACSPLIIKQLINFVQYRYFGLETTYNKGIGWTLFAVVLIFINGLLLNHYFHNAMVTGAAVKLILTKDVLLKSFKLLAKGKHQFPTGRITALVSTDLLRIDLAVGFQPLVICCPIPVIIAIALLLTNIGVPSLAGIGLFVLSLIACVLLTSKLFFTRESLVKYTDERISLMREVLNNLKIIKFYAWELAYKANITKVREREMRYLFTIKVLRNFITAYAVTLPTLTSMVSFVTMWSTDNMKAPGEVFSSLSLFSILAQAIMLLPIALSTGADAMIGFRRCKEFLSILEYDDSMEKWMGEENFYVNNSTVDGLSGFDFDFMNKSSDSSFQEKEKRSQSVVIEVKHADFRWEQFLLEDDDKNTLWKEDAKKELKRKPTNVSSAPHYSAEGTPHVVEEKSFPGLLDVTLTVNAGEFVVITGLIGSGKSSLLNALAGFMKLSNPERGTVEISSDLLLCGAPWIQNTSVKENILFGKPMDRARYKSILSACCLDDDMKELPYGDNTEIGERGITLSGGQKARINLARAVYNGATTLLFDDVLSAVDSRVGKHIISGLFEGLLKNNTRILATHQLSLVLSADKIIYLNGDGSIDVGSANELRTRNLGFQKLFEYSSEANRIKEAEEDDFSPNQNYSNEDIYSTNVCLLPGTTYSPNELSPTIERADSRISRRQSIAAENDDALGKTIEDEDVCVNAVSWDVYKKYIELGSGIFGMWAAPIFLFLVALSTFCQLFTNTWLSFWMENRFEQLLDGFYVTMYVILAILTVGFTGVQFTMLAYMNNISAELLNVKAVAKVLHSPMSFMDTNPLGRVLNRFTKDTDSLDNEIGEQLRLFIFPLATIIGIVILCICYLPWFAIAVPFLGGIFIFFSEIYSGSSREIKRLEAVQRSVVYNNFNETLTGMNTIKAYKSESTFIQRNDYTLNRMNEAYFLSIANQRWLCIHLDTMASMFALIICMLCVTDQFGISASSTGLLLNYVIQIVGLLSLTIRALTCVENEMNSVERLHHYAFNLPQEAAYEKSEFKPPAEWPIAGYIQFNDVSLRYRPTLPLVLKDLSFGVYPGEKLGICGRTGAGKSSIMTGLYRLSELEKGSITIDGLDISQIGLKDLRSKMSIIPQDPVLFQGTIRKNLDPFDQYEDSVLWDSLRRSGLIDEASLERVKHSKLVDRNYDLLHKFHLDRNVEDDGSNFSLGEKQLIALARSLVRDSKILILDEATSSVDYETDATIQETIMREFDRSTILCIAHRLKTILHYDRILVMDQGRVVEKGVPWTLYRQNGLFKAMCDKAQITAEDFRKPT